MGGTVYLSGPITGLTYDTARYGWRQTFAGMLEEGITVLSPMRHEGHLAEMRGVPIEPGNLPDGLFSQSRMIVDKDFLDIRTADVVVVNLRMAKIPSQGTLIEYGYAAAFGKPIITIALPDDLLLHKSPFIPVLSTAIVSTQEEAAAIVNSLLSEGL